LLRLFARGLTGIALLLATGRTHGTAAEERALYERADLVEALTGEVQLRRAYTRPLQLPLPECVQGRFACTEDTIYGQVYELSFTAEKLSRQGEGVLGTDRADRGRLLAVLDLSKPDEDSFEDACRAELASLSPAAFSLPQAGMGYLRGAFSQELLQRSARPAWVCTELRGNFLCDIVAAGGAYSAEGEIADRVGRTIGQVTGGIPPDIIRSPPDIRAQERTAVRFRSSSTLTGLTWSDRLAPVPGGATFTKQPLEGKKTGGSRDSMGGVYRGHEGRFGETAREVRLPAASLELLGVPMWVSEWRFEKTHETFGATPTARREPPVSVVLALAPIADPLMDALSRSRSPLTVPADTLVDAAVMLFGQRAKLEPSLVADAIANPQLWPDAGDWLIVECRDDGTARYGIAPFASAAAVTNASETCAAIRRELQ
jgi:hypothetical protein